MKTIYFNQWFSSIANVIEDIKSRNMVRMVASSRTPEHAYRYSVDKFVVEDWEEVKNSESASMKNYVDWVLTLCEREHVDLFFVKKHAVHIMKQAKRFEELGVILISEDYQTLKSMESKVGVYEALDASGITSLQHCIPEFRTFEAPEDAVAYVEKHRKKNNICLKFDKDEGGASFRAIKDKKPSWKDLYFYDVNTMTTDETCQLISDAGKKVNRLIFMEMLDSPEISIDCYNSENGFIALARMKVGGRKQKLFYDEALANVCKEMGDVLGLKFPYNVQFRVKAGGHVDNIDDLRLLEINPRMSGGLYYEVLCGKNIAEVCMREKLGFADTIDMEPFINFEDQYVTHVEKGIIITE